ncbi:hypothetical protein OS187_03645 [Xanthomonadaceae bacterium JHOS43]|nr:hypothetical protein [Xanthomonadaceae bacterium JHOS43]
MSSVIGIIVDVLLIALPGRDHATPIPFRPAFGGDQLAADLRLKEEFRYVILASCEGCTDISPDPWAVLNRPCRTADGSRACLSNTHA